MSAKHQIIYDEIVNGISAGRYRSGERMPTECELADRFAVSRQTVLKALNTLKSQGFLIGHQGKGTFVADRTVPRRAATRQIAYVSSNLQDSFAHRALIGIEEELGRADYSLIACNTANNVEKENHFLRRLHRQGIDGVILNPYQPEANAALVAELVRGSDPLRLVCLDRGYGGLPVPVVRTNNRQAAFEGISWLIGLGHRRIGFMVGRLDTLSGNEVVRERYRGYCDALAAAGIAFDPDLVQELGASLANRRPRDVGLDLYGYTPMHRLLSLPEPPTAAFLLWDELAPGAAAAIANSGRRCPEDVSLLGFNDDDLCTLMTPQLATVRQPAEELGRRAAALLLHLLDGDDVAPDTVLENRLIIRGSVAARSPEYSPSIS